MAKQLVILGILIVLMGSVRIAHAKVNAPAGGFDCQGHWQVKIAANGAITYNSAGCFGQCPLANGVQGTCTEVPAPFAAGKTTCACIYPDGTLGGPDGQADILIDLVGPPNKPPTAQYCDAGFTRQAGALTGAQCIGDCPQAADICHYQIVDVFWHPTDGSRTENRECECVGG